MTQSSVRKRAAFPMGAGRLLLHRETVGGLGSAAASAQRTTSPASLCGDCTGTITGCGCYCTKHKTGCGK